MNHLLQLKHKDNEVFGSVDGCIILLYYISEALRVLLLVRILLMRIARKVEIQIVSNAAFHIHSPIATHTAL